MKTFLMRAILTKRKAIILNSPEVDVQSGRFCHRDGIRIKSRGFPSEKNSKKIGPASND